MAPGQNECVSPLLTIGAPLMAPLMLCGTGQVHSTHLLTAEPTLMGRSTCGPLESLKGMLMGWSSCTAPMPALRAGPCCCSCSPLEVG